MSLENLKEYARRCAAEPDLRAKAKEIGVADVDEHMRHAESLGLDWTMDDLVDFRKEVIDSEGEYADLSEEDLEQIAGGAISVTAIAAISVVTTAAVVVGGAAAAAAGGAAVAGGVAAAGDGGW